MNTRKMRQTNEDEPKPTLTRLKELPPETHSRIMEILETHTYKDAQPLVAGLAGFECTTNALFKFRQWRQMEEALDHDTELLENVEAYLKNREGKWSPERIQKSALGFLMLQALGKRDAKAFSSVTRLWMRREQLELKEKKLALDELRFEDYHQRKLDLALDALADQFKKNPEARKLYWQAKRLILPNETPQSDSQAT
ncbi:MAG TPA: hypothetical protein VN761_08670 [Candidatus Polarisedimenticolia bacterium]|nr:hypothetical protein [Candidatus Polarisedimenticolia bacterium]